MGPPENCIHQPDPPECAGRRKRPAHRPRTRPCLLKGCERPFRPRRARQRYCSQECRRAMERVWQRERRWRRALQQRWNR
jgi:hypothetical protein